MPSKKLFLLDAMALIYRAHFAFSRNPRINSKNLNTSAVLGFANTLLEILNKEKPTHIGVAFDTPEPTFRHQEFSEYKANRDAQPEDITVAIPLVIKLCEAFRIPILKLSGYEADDVIGTLAKKAHKSDFQVFMMTPDKDFAQLVDENIFLYKPARMGKGVEILGVPEVLEKWKIQRVDQVRDVLGLQGDSVDNIPGIPGIGAKTAVKLLAKFDTVQGLVENAHQLKGKQKEKVIEFGQQGILSKKLATIDIDSPIELDEKALKYNGFDADLLRNLLDELEFRTLKRKLFPQESTPTSKPSSAKSSKKSNEPQLDIFGKSNLSEEVNPTVSELQTIENTPHDYHLIDTPETRKTLIHFLNLQDEFCFDTETDSLDTNEANLVGISFSYRAKEAYYVPVPEDKNEAQNIISEFQSVFENEAILKIGQNLKYDISILKKYNIKVKGKLFDTMLAHYLLEPDQRHNMDILAENYLNYSPVSIETLIGKKGKNQKSMRSVAVEKVAEYAGEDADITFQLKQKFAPQIQENNLSELFENVELPLISVLSEIELSGVTIDTETLKNYSLDLAENITEIENKIYEQAGDKFNIASPRQLGEILFNKLKLDKKPKKTKTGQFATGEEILIKLADKNEIVQNILDFRQLQKLKSTYVDALPELVSKMDGLIHTSYNQAVAATGRLSSTNPNLQNIPIRTERGREIRKAFIPRSEDFILMAADYSQIELRIMAEFSQDESMIQTFREGKDIHAMTASKLYNVKIGEVDSEMRRRAKTANFGIIYGISVFGLSQRLNIPRKEAKELIENYFSEFPAIKSYMDEIINFARKHEYVETVLKRRRYLRDINSRNANQRSHAERNAINAPIQGSAADMIKLAMIKIHQEMQRQKLQSRMIMQVHDELVFDVYKPEEEKLRKLIQHLMTTVVPMKVPLEIEIGTGKNWLEAH